MHAMSIFTFLSAIVNHWLSRSVNSPVVMRHHHAGISSYPTRHSLFLLERGGM